MSAARIATSVSMILRMLMRRRIVLLLLLVIPAVFLTTVALTTSERLVPFRLASIEEEPYIEVSEEEISMVFFAVATAGFLMSFLGLSLIQKHSAVNRRLVLCGYHPVELLVANFLALIGMILFVGVYVAALSSLFVEMEHPALLVAGLCLSGLVYGCYGLLVGTLIRGELEGILLIVLLVNIDAGWLQNPLFYAEAQNQVIIRYLPAYFPSQTSIIASFTDYGATRPILLSLVYGGLFLALAMLIFFTKMRVKS